MDVGHRMVEMPAREFHSHFAADVVARHLARFFGWNGVVDGWGLRRPFRRVKRVQAGILCAFRAMRQGQGAVLTVKRQGRSDGESLGNRSLDP